MPKFNRAQTQALFDLAFGSPPNSEFSIQTDNYGGLIVSVSYKMRGVDLEPTLWRLLPEGGRELRAGTPPTVDLSESEEVDV